MFPVGESNLITLMVAFQALVHSPLIWTFLAGSDRPRDISVDPTRPRFSLGVEIWCNDENTASRLMAWPLMMLSHSEVGKPSGAVHKVWIHTHGYIRTWLIQSMGGKIHGSGMDSTRCIHEGTDHLIGTSSRLAPQGYQFLHPRFKLSCHHSQLLYMCCHVTSSKTLISPVAELLWLCIVARSIATHGWIKT